MEKFNLRSALEKNGAALDENQIKFVSAFENALEERTKALSFPKTPEQIVDFDESILNV